MIVNWKDPKTAPLNIVVLVFGSGGVRLGIKDDLGNWRGRHGGIVRQPPSHWAELPDGPEKRNNK